MKEFILHIGYPKTATSWLQRLVFNNQEIHLKTVPKGLIFRQLIYPNDLDYNEEKARKQIFSEIAKIESHGDIPILSHENLVGFIASGGYYNFNLAWRLKDLFGRAKIIMIIRSQLEMIYSSYLQYLKMGGKCGIKRFLNPPKDGEIPLFKYEYFEYHKLIELYHYLFGKKNVLVLPYELFIKDPKAYLEKITSFINIKTPSGLDFDKIENRSMRGIGIPLKRFVNNFVSRYESLNADVPIVLPTETAELVKGACNKLADLTPHAWNKKVSTQLLSKIEKNIKDRYYKSNRKTSNLISMNLKEFNYECDVHKLTERNAGTENPTIALAH